MPAPRVLVGAKPPRLPINGRWQFDPCATWQNDDGFRYEFAAGTSAPQ